MRTGWNPQKSQSKIKLDTNHRVVIVVFIPKPEGYYEKVLEVFKLCLDSLIRVNTNNYKITVVNNGSCKELEELLRSYSSREIDCIINHSSNIGKIDALIGAARGSRENYITLTDTDILFLDNWDKEVLEIFKAFKKVGSVSPIPVRQGLFYGTSSVLGRILFHGLKYRYAEIPENFEDHNKYLSSINWNQEKDPDNKWPVIENNNVRAIIGSGHQVLTIKRDILFETVPVEPSLTLVGGDSEYKYVDEAIDKSGRMRLSTFRNKAYHMGNEVEPWMLKKLAESKERGDIKTNENFYTEPDENNHLKISSKLKQKAYGFRKAVFKRLFRLYCKH